MKCNRCLNEDESYFYKGSRGYYCRKCISFGRSMLKEEIEAVKLEEIRDDAYEYKLRYPLTIAQKKIAYACLKIIEKKDVLIHAITGAGKTEVTLPPIAKYLKEKKKVCFAIPRRQVVLELAYRFQKYFPNAKVVAVCQGYTTVTDGDLIVCTTHQLYRYYKAFDLLILDEPDAFPFRGNEVLHGIAKTGCRGHIIYLTATPDKELLEKEKRKELVRFTLNRRPHNHPLAIPEVIVGPSLYLFLRMILWLNNRNKPRMIFVPTIKVANYLGLILKLFYPSFVCTSKTENRDEVIKKYKEGNNILVCTTVMERGVTIENVDVCVLYADHAVFDEASLTQISGRVGRTFKYPEGNALFMCNSKSKNVYDTISSIVEANA